MKTLQAYVPINTFVYNNEHNVFLKIFSICVYSTFQPISSAYTGSIFFFLFFLSQQKGFFNCQTCAQSMENEQNQMLSSIVC